MPKSKQRKDHKKKVTIRNKKVEESRNKVNNSQNEFIKNIIKKEQDSGKFDNNPVLDEVKEKIVTSGPII